MGGNKDSEMKGLALDHTTFEWQNQGLNTATAGPYGNPIPRWHPLIRASWHPHFCVIASY